MQIDIIDETNQFTDTHETLLRKLLYVAAKKEDIHKDSELSVVIMSDAQMKQLNKDYRQKNEATDVLSFPLLEREEIMQHDKTHPIVLGDIIISIDRATEQANVYHHTLERELGFLAVHGFLHLLGYTHDTEDEEKEMFAKQERILKGFRLER